MPPAVVGTGGDWSLCPSELMACCPSHRAARKEYIMAKYMERRYVQKSGRDDPHRLWEAIRARDLLALLQAFAEGHDLAKPLASSEGQVSPALPQPPRSLCLAGGDGFSPLCVLTLGAFLAFGWRCALGKMIVLRSSSLLLSILWEMKYPWFQPSFPLVLELMKHAWLQLSSTPHFGGDEYP